VAPDADLLVAAGDDIELDALRMGGGGDDDDDDGFDDMRRDDPMAPNFDDDDRPTTPETPAEWQ